VSERTQPILQDLTRQAACLLRVELLPVPDKPLERFCRAVVMTFDVGLYIVEPSPAGEEIRVARLPDAEAVPEGVIDAEEEEPWWALLGAPLVAAAASLEPDGHRRTVDLEFRRENPRIISLTCSDRALTIRSAAKS
jgi:hypothetical protein